MEFFYMFCHNCPVKLKIKLGKSHNLIRFRLTKIHNRFRTGVAHEKKYSIFTINATHLSVPV